MITKRFPSSKHFWVVKKLTNVLLERERLYSVFENVNEKLIIKETMAAQFVININL